MRPFDGGDSREAAEGGATVAAGHSGSSPPTPAPQSREARRTVAIACWLSATVCLAIYWRTAYPTITWWDSPNYSLAATTLGITAPPGSLLLTLLGWPFTRIALGLAPAHTLNLLAGVIAAATVGLVCLAAQRLYQQTEAGRASGTRPFAAGAALGAIAFGAAATQWEHAIKFTPYILTALFTAGLVVTLLRWWKVAADPTSWRRLAFLGLLFGLDFSVHRTNALLLPGALVWILLRHPSTLRQARSWLAGAGGLLAGLSLQLALIPLAATTTSPVNMFPPKTWAAFWDYVSLDGRGGGFLLDLWPRNAPLWGTQSLDFLRTLGVNFADPSSTVALAGALPLVAAVTGLGSLFSRDRRLARAMASVLVVQAVTTIAYFNIPADYFRPFDRHYLPCFVLVGVLVAYGAGQGAQWTWDAWGAQRPALACCGAALVAAVPIAQMLGQWREHDASRRYFARDYGVNALEGLPRDAIYVTVGDNDTFPVMYLQTAEGVRPDVRIVNLSLANTRWWVDQMVRRDSTFPVVYRPPERLRGTTEPPPDSVVVVAITYPPLHFGLDSNVALPDSFVGRPTPSYGSEFTPADRVLLDIVRNNRWRAPLTFATTGGEGAMSWLAQNARLDGLYWRIVPLRKPPINPGALHTRLFSEYQYRGYADSAVVVDPVSRIIGFQYVRALEALLRALQDGGDLDACRRTRAEFFARVPAERIDLPVGERAELEQLCR
jgi:hypothetical protein